MNGAFSWRRALFASVFCFALGGTSNVAYAQPKPAPEKVAADQRAKELFGKGDTAYSEGRYEEALSAFNEAYDLSGRPQLLFNISNAAERLGRYQEAVDALEKYLASGKAKDKDVVQKRIANLRKRLDDQKAEQDRIAKEEEAKKQKEEEERKKREAEQAKQQPVAPPPEKPKPILPWILIGGGAAVFVTGGVFGVLTLGARSDAKSGCTDSPSGHLCNDTARSALDREKTFGIIADVGMLAGLVLGGVGAYFLITQKPTTEPSVKVGVGPGAIDLVGRF
jgi:tetratricopeptide (TPR) repeat protein